MVEDFREGPDTWLAGLLLALLVCSVRGAGWLIEIQS